MPSDRGPYRAIAGVLLDGPDFQQLPERARFAFLVTKINFGPAGIDVFYPQALAATVAEQTGMPFDVALRHVGPGGTLHHAGWLAWEGNVVWVIGQLEHEPNMKPGDSKHRKSIQRHITGLPRLDVVARFIQAHPDWFPFDGEALDDVETDILASLQWALVRAFKGPSKAPATTEDRVPKTDNRGPRTERAAAPAPASRRWRRVPTDWQPRPEDDNAELTASVRATELAKYRDHEFEKAKSDPDAAWRNWQRRAADDLKRSGTRTAPVVNGGAMKPLPRAPRQEMTRAGEQAVSDLLERAG